jgi:hypothetical protein
MLIVVCTRGVDRCGGASSSRFFLARYSRRVQAHARSKQSGRVRIGVLMSMAADDPESRARVGALLQGLQELGWTDGRNIRLEIPLGGGRNRPHSRLRQQSWSRSHRTS